MYSSWSRLPVGSPPRVRGTRPGLRRRRGQQGLTPAGAGNTGRVRSISPVAVGSPPRVRGTLPGERHAVAQSGLIPAGAGNTVRTICCRRCGWAHPRGCGEHIKSPDVTSLTPGSPPRVRGTPLGVGQHSGDVGLTPAGAGNTPHTAGSEPPVRAHPRGCGEHEHGRPRPVHGRGLTPAGAGNTRTPSSDGSMIQAHPRGCGEHGRVVLHLEMVEGSPPRVRGTPVQSYDGWAAEPGSPPRVRGTHVRSRRRQPAAGLTPAGAGNTVIGSTRPAICWAHPRGCGEHCWGRSGMSGQSGSPPRVRGTPSRPTPR